MTTRTELPAQFGRYHIVKKLGEGGMGAVYLAEDTQLARQVALKVPHFSDEDGPQVLERFQREARVAAAIEHPNVCPVYDIGAIDGIHYLTMPFIGGVTLSQKVKSGGPLPPGEALALVRRLALAIGTLHQRGVIHCDLKPGNVLLRPNGEPVVMDFGLARSYSGTGRVTATGSPLGTPAYMSPEQIKGEQTELGPATDIYSLGVILYELLTGRLPFTGSLHSIYGQILHNTPPPPSQLRPGLESILDSICLKAMAKNSADRYADMAEFAAALPVLAGRQQADPTLTTTPPVARPVKQATISTEGPLDTGATIVPPTRAEAGKLSNSPTQPEPAVGANRRPWLTRRRLLLALGVAFLAGASVLSLLYLNGVFNSVESQEQRLARIRASVKPRTAKTSSSAPPRDGKPCYNYYQWIEAPPEIMSQIARVIYDFHNPQWFEVSREESSDRDAQFRSKGYIGTGAWAQESDVILVLLDGTEITLKFNMYESISGK